ncbi:MAG: SPOR domain-containing protein [Comamonas sp.]
MAFFKFPWANEPQEPAKGSSGRSRAARGESIEELRRRARQRLIGAVILVLAGVIVFPLIFDTEPRTVPVKVAIDIPDRNASAPLVVEGASAKPDTSKVVPADASLVAGEEQVGGNAPRAAPVQPQASAATPTAAPAAVANPESRTEAKPAPQPEHKAESKPEPKARPKAEAPPAPAPAPSNDAARARALLEGHAPKTAVAAAPSASAQGERVVVQVGAYADPGKVREVRARLERAGIKTYAQEIQGKDGTRTTRVRVGPFASRAEAAKVLGRIKGLGLDGVVLAL